VGDYPRKDVKGPNPNRHFYMFKDFAASSAQIEGVVRVYRLGVTFVHFAIGKIDK